MRISLRPGPETAIPEDRTFNPGSNIIIFTSAKGGAGCSFLADSVAAYMACKTTLNVLLVDMNPGRMDSRMVFGLDGLHVRDMGSLPAVLETMDTSALKKIVINMEDSLNIILPSLDAENRNIFHTGSLNVFIEALRDHFDLVIIDMPGNLMGQIDLSETDIPDRFIFVSLPDNVSAANTRLLMDHIGHYRSSYDFYLVINKYNIKRAVSPAGLSNIIRHPVAAFIPYDLDIEEIFNNRGPGSIFKYNLKLVRNISGLAQKIYQGLGI
jgi:pilus assembly protein CpaE